MQLFESLNFAAGNLLESTQFLRAANLLCVLGIVAAAWSARAHSREQKALRATGGTGGTGATGDPASTGGARPARIAVGLLFGAVVITSLSVWNRYVEVNHFPSQTMSEVLVMFGFALLISMLVLHFALKWREHGPGWAVAGDSILLVVFAGVWLTNFYSSTLSTAQRDLPPALQSYWFAPHLAALIFSYATLGIAGVICAVYFCIRFWTVLRHGGRSKGSQLLILAVLALVPFAHFVTLPLLLLVGLILLATRSGPSSERLSEMEKRMDEISYRAFSVGFPFLTAGLFMGAFWAQEAWANYWGWDSKENSALITWLVYVVYIHLRMLGGYRGEKAMAVLMGGALSVFLTFQIFGYLPDSQKSLHRYTDDQVVPMEGQQAAEVSTAESARLDRQDER